MKRHHPSAILIAQVLGLVLVGCGREALPDGSDGSTSDSGSMDSSTGADSGTSEGSSSSTSGSTSSGTTGTTGGGGTSGSGGGDELETCYAAFWIPANIDPLPGGWPPPMDGGDSPLVNDACQMWVDQFPPGDEGYYTCNCLEPFAPATGDPVQLVSWSLDAANARCCFQWEYSYGGEEGRPFIVDGEVRRAEVERRDDWCTQRFMVRDSRLTPEAREAIANAYLDSARMEHASIPAFSRHLMQLMALGAPADLVRDTEQALRDEIRHARSCFSLAYAYSGIALGPASFPLEDAPVAYELLAITREVLIEGCIGETLAALTAQRAAQTAAPPDLRRCLEGIARDEMNHSMLAWRFVQWARNRDKAGVDALLVDLLRELESKRETKTAPEGISYPEHGQLGTAEKLRIRRRAERDVVIPLIRSMLVEPADSLSATLRVA